MQEVKITFGIIVLNGEPFTKYCIRSLYAYAYQIIISEGACFGARTIAKADGHSIDGTLETLQYIKENEDPDNKIIIVTAEDEGYPNGFWPGEKSEQSQAFAKRASGNYLWQVDIDEFYLEEDILKLITILSSNDPPTCISFKQIGFWGGFNYIVESNYFKYHLNEIFRIFRWEEGYQYITHRPPTVKDKVGYDVKEKKWMSSKDTSRLGIYMYHYSFVFPKQVQEKIEYYRNADWSRLKKAEWWVSEVFYNLNHPYKAFINIDYPGWIKRINVKHPNQIKELISDLDELKIELRQTSDLEKLTNSISYKAGIIIIKLIDPLFKTGSRYFKSLRRKLSKIIK